LLWETCIRETYTISVKDGYESTRTSSEIADTDLYAHADRTLVAASEVVAEPRDVGRLRWVDCACGDEDARVYNARFCGHPTHGETYQHREHSHDDEGSPAAFVVR